MLKQAAFTQARVIGALMLRETRIRYGRSKAGYLWALLEPAAYVTALSTMFYLSGAHPPFGKSMSLFFSLGILSFFMYRSVAQQLTGAFSANEALLNFPIVKEIDTVIARALLEVSTLIVVMLVVFSIVITLEGAPLPHSILKMLSAVFGLALFAFGVGLTNAVIITKFKSWQNIYNLLSAPLLFTSGVFYSLESLPTNIREILAWSPIIHGVETMRDGYFLNYRASAVDISYLYWCGIVMLLVGLASERAIRIRRS